MDYRKFLGTVETLVLPHLGGLEVHARDRRLRLTAAATAGWWSFEVRGRHAAPVQPADPVDLSGLPSVRGHFVDAWLFVSGRQVERVYLMQDEQPAPLSAGLGRRWPSGDVLFERYEFDDTAEIEARAELNGDATQLPSLRGVVPSLKAAFGFAVLRRLAASRGLAVSPLELLGDLHEIAVGTRSPHAVLDLLEARRYTLDPGFRRPASRPRVDSSRPVEDRVCEALAGSGAVFSNGRMLDSATYEVTFRLRGETFIAIVDPHTLHVYDAGICLSGHDEDLGLHALPGVILEAIDTHQLHITRW